MTRACCYNLNWKPRLDDNFIDLDLFLKKNLKTLRFYKADKCYESNSFQKKKEKNMRWGIFVMDDIFCLFWWTLMHCNMFASAQNHFKQSDNWYVLQFYADKTNSSSCQTSDSWQHVRNQRAQTDSRTNIICVHHLIVCSFHER